jgi:hypothetical protein
MELFPRDWVLVEAKARAKSDAESSGVEDDDVTLGAGGFELWYEYS